MKRYEFERYDEGGACMSEDIDGDYVRYADHAAEVNRIIAKSEALALLRELNDALVIPGWLQPRVDAILDGSVAEPSTREECNRRIDELHAEIQRVAWIREGRPRQLPQEGK